MKKILIPTLALILLLTGCFGRTTDVTLDYGHSERYTTRDLDEAFSLVQTEFRSFDGCELYSLSYAGDEASQQELERQCRQSETDYSGCILLDSSFRSPKRGGGAWSPNTIYTWHWILLQEPSGKWKLVDWGYC